MHTLVQLEACSAINKTADDHKEMSKERPHLLTHNIERGQQNTGKW